MADPDLSPHTHDGRVAVLGALRDRLAADIDWLPIGHSDVAPLALRLTKVLQELDELGADTETVENPLDELARRREARRGTGS